MLARSGYGSGGALMEVSGEIAANATWNASISFSGPAGPTDISGLDWRMTFRCGDGYSDYGLWVYDRAAYTLSTDDETLKIETDEDSGVPCILQINVPASQMPRLDGDYTCDLASRDADGVVTAWAHGVVTFRPNPVAF